MNVEEFRVLKKQKISNAILSRFPNFTFGYVQKLLKQKDVKINGARVSKDIEVDIDDLITIYYLQEKSLKIEIV